MKWTERRAPQTPEEEEEYKYLEQLNRTPLHCFLLGNSRTPLKQP